MDVSQKLAAVLELAERLGVSVRRAPLGGEGGGLCVLKGRNILFLDTSADLVTQYARSVSALAQLPEIDGIYLVPAIRDDVDQIRRGDA